MKGESHSWTWTCCSYVFVVVAAVVVFCLNWNFPKKKKLHTRLSSRKFLSVKNFVKSDHQAVRQEYIFIKHWPSLRKKIELACDHIALWIYATRHACLRHGAFVFCLSFIFTFMNISDPTLVVLWKKNYSKIFKAGPPPPLIWLFGHFWLFCTMV